MYTFRTFYPQGVQIEDEGKLLFVLDLSKPPQERGEEKWGEILKMIS